MSLSRQADNPDSWYNGVTGQFVTGTPPDGWVQLYNGYWYPAEQPQEETILIDVVPQPATMVLTTHVRVVNFPVPATAVFPVRITVTADVPKFAVSTQHTPANLTISAIPLNLRDSMIKVLRDVTVGKVDNYFDVDRRGKTLLNFGGDYQSLISGWQYQSGSTSTIEVKLYEPLPDEVTEKTQLWITRELTPPVIDRLFVKFTPPAAAKVYLRPPNTDIKILKRTGARVENATLSNLLTTGSLNPVRQTDPVIERWYTTDVNSVDLNIDYSDYRNFVFFSSATSRLTAFINKLLLLEDYDRTLAFNSSSLAGTGSAYITGSSAFPALQALSDKRIDLVRSFDGYERFLYYGSGSAYSSSLSTSDWQDALYYLEDATYPKFSGSVSPVASASAWITSQMSIASEFDAHNQNYLGNNLPAYIKHDANSTDFIKFVDLVGHQFDLLKVYIDAMPQIFDRDSNPNIGISRDLAWNVAEAFGVDMPNEYSIKDLVDYTIGRGQFVDEKVYHEIAAETWKRFLHNQIFLMKTKGTKTALRTLANAYGILPTTLQIRESVTPGTAFPTGSFEIFEEQSTALNIPSGSFVRLPWAASSSLFAYTIEARFSTTDNSTNTVLLNADNTWALRLEPLSGSYGRLSLVSGSTVTVSTTNLPIYSGDFYSVMVRYDNTIGMDITLKRAETGDIVAASTVAEVTPEVGTIWFDPTNLYLGGSGSFFGRPFAGLVDEFRMWGEYLDDDVFDRHVRYPGMYNGNAQLSARDNLYVRLSFNKPKNLFSSPFLPNEAPSYSSEVFTTYNFPNISSSPYNMDVVVREVQRYSPNAGASQFSSNKVVIADPPQLKYLNGTDIPVLSKDSSIVSLQTKQDYGRNNNMVGFYFSVTDAINDSITRSVGHIDLQTLIGDPANQYATSYPELEALAEIYWTEYAYVYNINTFISFVERLLGPLFLQARNLIPIRAKLLSGIVHEPHILERSKVAVKPVNVSGGTLTRDNQNETQNLDADLGTSHPETIDAGVDSLETTVVMGELYHPMAENNVLETALDTTDIWIPSADTESLETEISAADITTLTPSIESLEAVATTIDINQLDASYVALDDYTNFLGFSQNLLSQFHVTSQTQLSAADFATLKQLLRNFQSGISINDQYIEQSRNRMVGYAPDATMETVLPYTNFETLEATTYFNIPRGLFAIPSTTYVLVGSGSVVDRGSWQKNTIYNRNDMVLQTGQIGDAENGNSKEFICISPDRSFTSTVAPFLDTRNWKPATYVPTLTPSFRKAAVISGSVSLVLPNTSYTAAVGYRPEHFKFTRDNRKGTLRHQWLGCLQDNTTTSDGKDPVEIFYVTNSELVVRNAGEPVQDNNNQSGPILDVRG